MTLTAATVPQQGGSAHTYLNILILPVDFGPIFQMDMEHE